MRGFVSQLGFLVTAFFLVNYTAAASDAMDLATLTAALRSQLSSIASIEVKFRMVSDTPEGRSEIQDDEWAEQGECLAFTSFLLQPVRNPESMLFDGAKGYQYTWDPSGKKAARLVLGDAIGHGYWLRITPAQFIGRRIGELGISLAELMGLPEAELVGPEMFGGRKCWRVLVKSFESSRKSPIQVSALLDEAHDFLPATITLRRVDDGLEHPDSPYRNKTFRTWSTNEFMRITDGATGAQRWFPKTAMLDTLFGLKYSLTVSSVTLNEILPIERFRPNSPDGTFVYDAKRGPSYHIQGGQAAEDALVQRAARDALSELRSRQSAPAVTIDARPRRLAWAAYGLFGSSALICALAAFFWFRRNMR